MAMSELASAALITALVGGLLLLATGVILSMVDFGRRLNALRAETAGLAEMSARMEAALLRLEKSDAPGQDRDAVLASIAADLAATRAEVEWLGGERMIEAAVRMCREGHAHARIAQDLGLSLESVRAIALLRVH
jgi:DNA-binding NarL/FixJ family response regulator